MSIKSLLVSLFRMPCLFHLMTGLYCPGCGGTRAVKYLLQGDWKNSLIYHPFVLYSVIAAALWAADAIYGKVCSGRRRRASKKRESLFLNLRNSDYSDKLDCEKSAACMLGNRSSGSPSLKGTAWDYWAAGAMLSSIS